jgi:hypothetical protein
LGPSFFLFLIMLPSATSPPQHHAALTDTTNVVCVASTSSVQKWRFVEVYEVVSTLVTVSVSVTAAPSTVLTRVTVFVTTGPPPPPPPPPRH